MEASTNSSYKKEDEMPKCNLDNKPAINYCTNKNGFCKDANGNPQPYYCDECYEKYHKKQKHGNSFRATKTLKIRDKWIEANSAVNTIAHISKNLFEEKLPLITYLEKLTLEMPDYAHPTIRMLSIQYKKVENLQQKMKYLYTEEITPLLNAYKVIELKQKYQTLDQIKESLEQLRYLSLMDNFAFYQTYFEPINYSLNSITDIPSKEQKELLDIYNSLKPDQRLKQGHFVEPQTKEGKEETLADKEQKIHQKIFVLQHIFDQRLNFITTSLSQVETKQQSLSTLSQEVNQFKTTFTQQLKELNQKLNRSNFLSTSKIVTTNNDRKIIQEFIGRPFVETNLLYSNKLYNSWNPQDFHRLCDNSGPTLIIIQADAQIFGGFTSKSWTSKSGDVFDDYAFLFSLTKKLKYTIKVGKPAVHHDPELGPCFGKNNALVIQKDMNLKATSDIAECFDLPSGQESNKALADQSPFDLKDMEVFQVLY